MKKLSTAVAKKNAAAPKWTSKEIAVIKLWAGKKSAKDIAELLEGRSRVGVQKQAIAHGVSLLMGKKTTMDSEYSPLRTYKPEPIPLTFKEPHTPSVHAQALVASMSPNQRLALVAAW